MISKKDWTVIKRYAKGAFDYPEEYADNRIYDGLDNYGNRWYLHTEENEIVLYYFFRFKRADYTLTSSWTLDEFLGLECIDFCNKLQELREQTIEGIL